jgi:hypothetical protein
MRVEPDQDQMRKAFAHDAVLDMDPEANLGST